MCGTGLLPGHKWDRSQGRSSTGLPYVTQECLWVNAPALRNFLGADGHCQLGVDWHVVLIRVQITEVHIAKSSVMPSPVSRTANIIDEALLTLRAAPGAEELSFMVLLCAEMDPEVSGESKQAFRIEVDGHGVLCGCSALLLREPCIGIDQQ